MPTGTRIEYAGVASPLPRRNRDVDTSSGVDPRLRTRVLRAVRRLHPADVVMLHSRTGASAWRTLRTHLTRLLARSEEVRTIALVAVVVPPWALLLAGKDWVGIAALLGAAVMLSVTVRHLRSALAPEGLLSLRSRFDVAFILLWSAFVAGVFVWAVPLALGKVSTGCTVFTLCTIFGGAVLIDRARRSYRRHRRESAAMAVLAWDVRPPFWSLGPRSAGAPWVSSRVADRGPGWPLTLVPGFGRRLRATLLRRRRRALRRARRLPSRERTQSIKWLCREAARRGEDARVVRLARAENRRRVREGRRPSATLGSLQALALFRLQRAREGLQLLESFPDDNPYILLGRSYLYRQLGLRAQALAATQRVLEIDPDCPVALCDQANGLLQKESDRRRRGEGIDRGTLTRARELIERAKRFARKRMGHVPANLSYVEATLETMTGNQRRARQLFVAGIRTEGDPGCRFALALLMASRAGSFLQSEYQLLRLLYGSSVNFDDRNYRLAVLLLRRISRAREDGLPIPEDVIWEFLGSESGARLVPAPGADPEPQEIADAVPVRASAWQHLAESLMPSAAWPSADAWERWFRARTAS